MSAAVGSVTAREVTFPVCRETSTAYLRTSDLLFEPCGDTATLMQLQQWDCQARQEPPATP